MRTKNIVAFTYELTPEKKGFSVKCLDWDCVFTQGDNLDECKKNAEEVTSIYLKDLAKGELHHKDYPNIKNHKANVYHFTLLFDLATGKPFRFEKPNSLKNIKPVSSKELAYA